MTRMDVIAFAGKAQTPLRTASIMPRSARRTRQPGANAAKTAGYRNLNAGLVLLIAPGLSDPRAAARFGRRAVIATPGQLASPIRFVPSAKPAIKN
jgi:hypothetical protein